MPSRILESKPSNILDVTNCYFLVSNIGEGGLEKEMTKYEMGMEGVKMPFCR